MPRCGRARSGRPVRRLAELPAAFMRPRRNSCHVEDQCLSLIFAVSCCTSLAAVDPASSGQAGARPPAPWACRAKAARLQSGAAACPGFSRVVIACGGRHGAVWDWSTVKRSQRCPLRKCTLMDMISQFMPMAVARRKGQTEREGREVQEAGTMLS